MQHLGDTQIAWRGTLAIGAVVHIVIGCVDAIVIGEGEAVSIRHSRLAKVDSLSHFNDNDDCDDYQKVNGCMRLQGETPPE